MLSSSATANDSRVDRNVIANTRAGIPIQRCPSEFVSPMLISYTIGPDHRDWQGDSRPSPLHAHTLQYRHVANRLRDPRRPGGNLPNRPGSTGAYRSWFSPSGENPIADNDLDRMIAAV